MPGIALGTWNASVNRTNKIPCLHGTHTLVEGQRQYICEIYTMSGDGKAKEKIQQDLRQDYSLPIGVKMMISVRLEEREPAGQ